MRKTQNSRISSTGRDSKLPPILRMDAVSIAEVADSATSDSDYLNPEVFPRSRVLGRATNPGTNKGMAHLIWAIEFSIRVVGATTAQLMGSAVGQIIRRDDDRFDKGSAFLGMENSDLVAWEGRRYFQNGVPGAGMPFTVCQNSGDTYERFPLPLVMVEPYYLTAFWEEFNNSAHQPTIQAIAYIYYETVRIDGEDYRRLLDAYTQIPG